MKKMILSLSMILALSASAFAAELPVTSTIPAQQTVRVGTDYQGYTVGFAQMRDGSYSVEVALEAWAPSPTHNGNFTVNVDFTPTEGSLARVGNQMIWTVNGQSIVVANKKWYTAWMLTDAVKLDVTVTPENRTDLSVSVTMQAQ